MNKKFIPSTYFLTFKKEKDNEATYFGMLANTSGLGGELRSKAYAKIMLEKFLAKETIPESDKKSLLVAIDESPLPAHLDGYPHFKLCTDKEEGGDLADATRHGHLYNMNRGTSSPVFSQAAAMKSLQVAVDQGMIQGDDAPAIEQAIQSSKLPVEMTAMDHAMSSGNPGATLAMLLDHLFHD